MIDTRPFAHDPKTGAVTKWFHYDDATDEFYIEDVVDLHALADHNKELAKLNTGRFKDGMHLIGSVPMPIWYRIKAKYPDILENKRTFARWWASDEALPFKVREGFRV